ncbi:hypothetical protein CGZ93_14060 [Enemella dayhoffiae]|uniref:Periplasmic binding protein domain-containing protein n=1 Tax=Enemella dayhoffiae TaxID=2016507 RepID=A0A255GRZ0_9ACTN|nr:sugar ABC transporter substrate-binding protein [Enemella dayhoffiae]OYO18558.1 hypothetical protein CGZ93_14060 [Enemella dayhoffiae]
MFTARIRAIIAVFATAMLALTGCSGGSSGSEGGATAKQVKIAIVTPYLANAATKKAVDEFKSQASPLGWSVSVTDTAGDMSKLNSAFQDAAVQKPSAIVMVSGDPTQASLGLKAAKNAKVPVYTIDAAPVDGVTANVASDNAGLGKMSAESLVASMGGTKGLVVMLTHDPHPGVNARAKGAEKVLTEQGMTIQKIHVNVPGPVDNARKSVQDAISANGDAIKGIWGGWDEPALGAVQALDAASKKVPVAGVDGQDFALAEIKKQGNFKSTVAQDWRAISGKVVELIKAQVETGKAPEKNDFQLPGQLLQD